LHGGARLLRGVALGLRPLTSLRSQSESVLPVLSARASQLPVDRAPLLQRGGVNLSPPGAALPPAPEGVRLLLPDAELRLRLVVELPLPRDDGPVRQPAAALPLPRAGALLLRPLVAVRLLRDGGQSLRPAVQLQSERASELPLPP